MTELELGMRCEEHPLGAHLFLQHLPHTWLVPFDEMDVGLWDLQS
jgi:hypothetical protein